MEGILMSRSHSLSKIFILMLVVVSIIMFSARFCFAAAHFSEDFEGDPNLWTLDSPWTVSSEDAHGRVYVHEDADYKVISSSVVMGAIANADSINIKPYLLGEYVNYFLGYDVSTSLQESVRSIITGDAFPNPLKDNTTISIDLNRATYVNVSIYSSNGSLIKRLVDENMSPGQHAINWDTTDENFAYVKKGIYICRIQLGNESISKKLIVLP